MFESNKHFPAVKSCTKRIQEVPLIAEFRCFYEYYYGQYLPTGMQAIALACCLGFDNLYLTGFDLFSDLNNLHAYPDGKSVMETVKNLGSTSIYDTSHGIERNSDMASYLHKKHPTEMQVKFVRLLQKIFPNTQFLSVSESSAINEYIEMAPIIYDVPWYSHKKKPANRTTDWYPLPEEMPSGKTSNI